MTPAYMTKREVAEARIRNAIETGHYVPGQVISQRRIEEDLGLSVTPIREAILVLCGNGIVERHKHHSIKAKEITPKRLREIFRVRRMLEQEAVWLVAAAGDDGLIVELERINDRLEAQALEPNSAEVNALDREFHTLIFGACGNEALAWTIGQVKASQAQHSRVFPAMRRRYGKSRHANAMLYDVTKTPCDKKGSGIVQFRG